MKQTRILVAAGAFFLASIATSAATNKLTTTAAVKATTDDLPTAAVLSDSIRMVPPQGEPVVVLQGDKRGNGTVKPLSAKAVESRSVRTLTPPASGAQPIPEHSNSSTAVAPTVAPQAVLAVALEQPSPEKPVAAPQKATTPTPETAQEQAKQSADPDNADKKAKGDAPAAAPKWEISAGAVTVDNEQWTRLALGVDVPFWKFGVFFDVEFFINSDGQVSDKGWNFKDDWVEAVTRKIRYVRFGNEEDPLFIKFGGLSSVTMGYGFLVDRFSNMLHYPDQKLLGLQFDLNDLTPMGISLQTLVADFKDFGDDGGVVAARLAFRPLKTTAIPIFNGLTIAGSYATDLNQYAPARTWDFTLTGNALDRDNDNIWDSTFFYTSRTSDDDYSNHRAQQIAAGNFDTIIEHVDQWASSKVDPFGIIGADVSLPLIATELLSLDLYAQAGLRDDGTHGWGIGAPGLALTIWRLSASVEYRHVEGAFEPGYFGTYYLDERLIRKPQITTKEQRLPSDTLNGVFGRLGFNIANALIINGSYQYMIGKDIINKDQRLEATCSVGELVLQRIPKLNRAEVYYAKSRIGSEHDRFFEETPYMYAGYRVGFSVAGGASLIWDARYGFRYNEQGVLIPNNFVSIMTAVTF